MEKMNIASRLGELRRELEIGQQQMAFLDQKRQDLRDTMLRIKGAIQVLEEFVVGGQPQSSADKPANIVDAPRKATG